MSIQAITIGAVPMIFLAFLTTSASAEVVYTPANVTLSGNGSIRIDMNHDGIKDFVLRSSSQVAACGNRGSLLRSTKMIPKTVGGGVVVSHLNFAAVLVSGISIDSTATFHNASSTVTQFFLCNLGNQHVAGYLGLELPINGQIHFGWAQIIIDAHYDHLNSWMHTTLVDYAYENIPGHPIKTGQTSGNAKNVPESIHPNDSGIGPVNAGANRHDGPTIQPRKERSFSC